MTVPAAADVTRLLRAWRSGEDGALDRLMPLVYDELRRVAHARMRAQRPGHLLQTTAIVHEVFLRLVDARDHTLQNRTHFFAVCAQAVRQILVDAARARDAAKRGGGAPRVALEEWMVASPPPETDLLALDEALSQLAAEAPRQAQVVELRYFGGLSVEETAEVLGISPQTVMRDWQMAKLRLVRTLRRAAPRG